MPRTEHTIAMVTTGLRSEVECRQIQQAVGDHQCTLFCWYLRRHDAIQWTLTQAGVTWAAREPTNLGGSIASHLTSSGRRFCLSSSGYGFFTRLVCWLPETGSDNDQTEFPISHHGRKVVIFACGDFPEGRSQQSTPSS